VINQAEFDKKLLAWKIEAMGSIGAYLRAGVINSLKVGKKITINNAPTLEMSHAISLRAKIDKALGATPRQYNLRETSKPGAPPRISSPDSLFAQVIFKVAPDGNSVKVGPIGKTDIVPNLLEQGGTAKIKKWPSAYARLGVDVVTIDGQRTYGRVMGHQNGTIQYLQINPALKKAGKKGSIFRFIASRKAKIASTRAINATVNILPRPYLQPVYERAIKSAKFQKLLEEARF